MTSDTKKEKFCSECGKSLIPLDIPHISRECDQCGKEIHFVRRGEGGKGIKVEAGDRFTIPSGFMNLSLDPSANTKLFKPGVKYLVREFFKEGLPKSVDEIPELLERYIKKADAILENSELLSDFNLDNEDESNQAFELLKEKHRDSREWYAFLLGSFSELAKESIESGDTNKAVWAMAHASGFHSLTIVSEPTFEQTLWRGYLANQTVYEAAAAASVIPGESEAIKELQKKFDELDEVTLHNFVESGLPIGPRIGVSKVPEPRLLALAKFHLTGYKKKREDERLKEEQEIEMKKFNREMKIKWFSIGTGIATVVLAAIGIILRVFGIL